MHVIIFCSGLTHSKSFILSLSLLYIQTLRSNGLILAFIYVSVAVRFSAVTTATKIWTTTTTVTKKRASFMMWMAEDVAHMVKYHKVPCLFAIDLLFFIGMEYTLRMVPSSSEPFDLGFVTTRSLYRVLSASPELNTFLAFLNTVCALSLFPFFF